MNERNFRLSLAAIGMAVLASAPAVPGGIIGGIFAFGIAFFVALPCGLAAEVLQRQGIPATLHDVLFGALAIYILIAISMALLGWRVWSSGNAATGRLLVVKAALLASLPLIGYLSTNAMSKAWTSL